MRKLLVSIGIAIILSGCDNADPLRKEQEKMSNMIKEVSRELLDIGFAIDLSSIAIKVERARDMAKMFNNLSDQSQQNFALGPKDKAQFDDGINSRLAFYDPNSKTIVLRYGASKAITKGYLAHELAHVYQDQKWGFEKIWKPYQAKPSREMFNVTQFMVEGYAELVRQSYDQNIEDKGMAKVQSVVLGKVVENDCLVCNSEITPGDLPYSLGLRFLAHQYKEGGWPLVDSFMTHLPDSTEQIIHPKKYEVDQPRSVDIPKWPIDAELVLDGSMGEASLLARLFDLSVPNKVALEAASGWEGDTVQLYRKANGQEILIWRIIFDRVLDAQQLEDALKTHTNVNNVFRVGPMVDWILGGSIKLKKEARIFLSENLMNIKSEIEDEESTKEQENDLKNDANLLINPYQMPKLVVGPNN